MIACVVAGLILGTFALFEMLHTPTARVVYAIVFGGCVVIIAAGLYLMPPRDRQ